MKDVNFNLLKALDALLVEKNVSKAGKKLGVTQAAVSLSLKQLRDVFQDALLVRSTRGQMQLTPLAQSLIQPVRAALQQAQEVFTAHLPFQPKDAIRTFHIGMSDYVAFVLLPKLMQEIAKTGPNVKIVQHPMNYLDSLQPFEQQSIDIAVGQFFDAPVSLQTMPLFIDRSVIVADKNHPAMQQKLTIDKFLYYPQVFVALENKPDKNFIVDMLQRKNYDVNVALITPHTLIALQTLPGTNLMTNTVERLAKPFIQSLGLAMCNTPYVLPNYQATMYWHIRDTNDLGHLWLRNLIQKISDEIK